VRSAGFTLVEVMVALAVSTLLILGVGAAARSAVRFSEAQKAEGRAQERRFRAVEILRQDWRGRLRLLASSRDLLQGGQSLNLVTTADSLLATRERACREVVYRAGDRGLIRQERDTRWILVEEAATLEFWDGRGWNREPRGEVQALRVTFSGPAQTIVIR